MIFNNQVLFLHVPKTGGLSMTRFLLEALPPPVTITHPIEDPGLAARGIRQILGNRHETLADARALLAGLGLAIADFRLVIAAIRNPYDQELSRYAYLRRGLHWEAGAEQELAMRSDFATFAVENRQAGGCWDNQGCGRETAGASGVHDYYTLNGAIPANLRLLRFERLGQELTDALLPFGIATHARLTRENRSDHPDFADAYTAPAEAAVYARYRRVFEHGHYERRRFAPPPTGGAVGGTR